MAPPLKPVAAARIPAHAVTGRGVSIVNVRLQVGQAHLGKGIRAEEIAVASVAINPPAEQEQVRGFGDPRRAPIHAARVDQVRVVARRAVRVINHFTRLLLRKRASAHHHRGDAAGIEDLRLGVGGESLAGDFFRDPGGGHVFDVRVVVSGARGERRWHAVELVADDLIVTTTPRWLGVVPELAVVWPAGGVIEQVAGGEIPFVGAVGEGSIVVAKERARAEERAAETPCRGVLERAEHGDGADGFGHAGDAPAMERMGRFARRSVGITKAARIHQPALAGDGHRKAGDAAAVNVRLDAGVNGVQARGGKSAVADPSGIVVSFGAVVVWINENRAITLIVCVQVLRGETFLRHPMEGPTFAAIEFQPHAGEPFGAADGGPVDADESVAVRAQGVECGLIPRACLVVTELHVRRGPRSPHPSVQCGAVHREGTDVNEVKSLRLIETIRAEMRGERLPQCNPLGCSTDSLPDGIVIRDGAHPEAIKPDQPVAGGVEVVMGGLEGGAVHTVTCRPSRGLAAFLEDRCVPRRTGGFTPANAGRPVPIRRSGPEVELGLPGSTRHSVPLDPGQGLAGGGTQPTEKREEKDERRSGTAHQDRTERSLVS